MRLVGEWVPWGVAMERALVGPEGFYLGEAVPAANFRTSVTAAPELVASAITVLFEDVQAALGAGRADPGPGPAMDLVDLGAGGGELLAVLADTLPEHVRLHGVDVGRRPPGLAARVRWSATIPEERIVGLLLAYEYLDNVPVDVAEIGPDGVPRLVLVDPATGEERLGGSLEPGDAAWLGRWWSLDGAPSGTRAEIGRARDVAWSTAVSRVGCGVVLAVDYDHGLARRPASGTLAGYRRGRMVPAVPDGSCDVTAHVALDACAEAGVSAGARATALVRQADALAALGVAADRPDVGMAREDPLGYLRALDAAGTAAELLDRSGLGGFGWLVQSVGGIGLPERFARTG